MEPVPSPPPPPVVIHPDQVPTEAWGDIVSWHTLLSGDRTPTTSLTVGLATLDEGAPIEGALHRHAPDEVYVILEGEGLVHIDGTPHPVRPGSTVWVPGGSWHHAENTGAGPLRLLYVFAVDSFADVVYEYPGPSDPPTATGR